MVFKAILGYLDRLSTKSVLTGYTGSICGFFGTILLIIISCIIFIPSAVDYFSGDYFQSEFVISDQSDLNQQYNTGVQIKLAVVFKNKLSNVIANHTQILEKVNAQYAMIFNGERYVHPLQACKPDYFQGQVNGITLEDCILIPSNLLWNTQGPSGFLLNLFCQSPFGCQGQQKYQFFVNLFKDYYHEAYFHSKTFLKDGTSTYQVFKLYSTQYSDKDSLSTSFNIYFDKQITEMDISVMPWRNNLKFKNLAWNGLAVGQGLNKQEIIINGASIGLISSGYNVYVNRYYKKLDWLIGILGGGVFLLFIIFYIIFSQINKILQKIYNSKKFLIESKIHPYENIDNFEKLSYNPCFYFLGCLPNIPPFSLIPLFQNNRRSIFVSESKLSIVNILKKLNCVEKNLQLTNCYNRFKSRKLCPSEENPILSVQNIQVPDNIAPHLENLQISKYAYQTINQSNKSSQIYENNPTALALIGKDSLGKISNDEIYDKEDGHLKKSAQPCYYHLKAWVAKIMRGFDIFGAEPNFVATPINYSCFGFLSTVAIVVLAVLTFCMTLYNMGKSYDIVQYDKVSAEDISIKLKTGDTLNMMLCFGTSSIAFLEGNNKALDFKYVQYKNNQPPLYFTPIKLTQNSIYMFGSPNNLSNCYKIPDGQNLQIKGGPKTQQQSYIGISIRPYCFGTASSCSNQNSAFLDAMNRINPLIYLSSNQYNPEQKITQKTAARFALNNNGGQITYQNHTIQEVKFYPKMEVIDDTSSFNNPKITREGLFSPLVSYPLLSINNTPDDLQYRFFLKSTGQVVKIISRSYKVHFLLGIIGGCFLFYYFIFHWLAKIYNSYNPRAKLAHYLYSQQGQNQCCCFMWCGLGCLPNACFPQTFSIKEKIQRIRLAELQMKKQLNQIQVTKKIDNCWKLSSSLFPNIQSKDLSLLYFRQIIQSNEQVQSTGIFNNIFQSNDSELQEDLRNDPSQFNSLHQESHQQELNINKPSSSTSQMIQQGASNFNNNEEKEFLNRQNRQSEFYDDSPDPLDFNNKYGRCAYSWIQKLDLFKIRGQFTFEGHRQVKSIFGGCCCLILTGAILAIIWNFFIAYSQGIYYNVSQQTKVVSENSVELGFEVGTNYKFMFTFAQGRDFQFKNISSYKPYITIQAYQVQINRVNNQLIKTFSQPYDFEDCSTGYFDGFYGQFITEYKYYKNITNGFCLPDNLKFSIAGGPASDYYKYFYFTIHPKDSSTATFDKYKEFCTNYSINVHYLNPTLNMHSKKIEYQVMQEFFNRQPYPNSFQTNLSLSKVIIQNQRINARPLSTYNFRSVYADHTSEYYLSPDTAWRNFSMNYNNLVTTFTVSYMKPSEFLGIIGGICALLIFFVWGCATSFNQYRMKYLIGKKLFRFQVPRSRFTKRKKQQDQQLEQKFNNYSQLDILHAWIISIRGMLQDYNFNQKLRHITLVQQRVEQQLNIFNFYRRLHAVQSSLNKKISINPDLKLTQVYFKDIHNNRQQPYTSQKMRKVAQKNFLTSYQQFKLDQAKKSKRVVPVRVLGTNYLDNYFNDNMNRSDNQSQIRSNINLTHDGSTNNFNMYSSSASDRKMVNERKHQNNIKGKKLFQQQSHHGIVENQFEDDMQQKVEAVHQREKAELQSKQMQQETNKRNRKIKLPKIQQKQQQIPYQTPQYAQKKNKNQSQENHHEKQEQEKQSQLNDDDQFNFDD